MKFKITTSIILSLAMVMGVSACQQPVAVDQTGGTSPTEEIQTLQSEIQTQSTTPATTPTTTFEASESSSDTTLENEVISYYSWPYFHSLDELLDEASSVFLVRNVRYVGEELLERSLDKSYSLKMDYHTYEAEILLHMNGRETVPLEGEPLKFQMMVHDESERMMTQFDQKYPFYIIFAWGDGLSVTPLNPYQAVIGVDNTMEFDSVSTREMTQPTMEAFTLDDLPLIKDAILEYKGD